eukprot:TRINITY_DN6249_c0_g1_i2.p1 TRINITY_DN6249_c0_g1~~TRINITY_DN6249_c0_g1_i2.p1  ORF type:complete len:315 (-),score=63.79 TRINITY_DN6249_c0_g1_i2:150-1094(-)
MMAPTAPVPVPGPKPTNASVQELRASMMAPTAPVPVPGPKPTNASVQELRASMMAPTAPVPVPGPKPTNASVQELRASMMAPTAPVSIVTTEAADEKDGYYCVDDEIEFKAKPQTSEVSVAVANAVAAVESEIEKEKELIIQEAARLRAHVQNTRAEVLRRREERTKLTNQAMDNTRDDMRQLYERMKLTHECYSPMSPEPRVQICKVSSPEGKQLSSTIQELRSSLLAVAACDEAEEPVDAEQTTMAKQAVHEAELCLVEHENRIQQLEQNAKQLEEEQEQQQREEPNVVVPRARSKQGEACLLYTSPSPRDS